MPDAMEPSRFSALPPDDILQQGPGFLPQQDIEEEIRLRKLWNDNMKNSPKAVRYLRTDVLMLSWEDTDLFTQPEVSPFVLNACPKLMANRLMSLLMFSGIHITSTSKRLASRRENGPKAMSIVTSPPLLMITTKRGVS